MVEQVYRRWGRIDVLINDAAIVTHFHVGSPRWPRIRDGGFSEDRPETPANLGSCVYATSKMSIRAFTWGVAAEERQFNICILSMGPGAGQGDPDRLGPGGLGGIITEDSPEWAREARLSRGVETVGTRYVIAAEAPMEFSGHQVVVRDGKLEIAPP